MTTWALSNSELKSIVVEMQGFLANDSKSVLCFKNETPDMLHIESNICHCGCTEDQHEAHSFSVLNEEIHETSNFQQTEHKASSNHSDVLKITDGLGVTPQNLRELTKAIIRKRFPTLSDREIEERRLPSKVIVKLTIGLITSFGASSFIDESTTKHNPLIIRKRVIDFFCKKELQPILEACKLNFNKRKILLDATRPNKWVGLRCLYKRGYQASKLISEINVVKPFFKKL